ncbi:uncharacterized protein LOC115209503 [Octopus sinensis]|uniref:Uncharacterized protein LOC115209503 n=1 Tax=Octopus sinensis TaxID=2607531 RepID=A0A6P7S6R2_9MOLL|nr:uncharacterized protein LOC115209503 [Octopus sinensis]
MNEIWHRGFIKYRQKNALVLNGIHADISAILGDDAPALSTVQKWAAEVRREGEKLEDDPKYGRHATSTNEEKIDRLPHMMDDKRLILNQIANVISISCERAENILRNELGMTNVSARWTPRFLTPDQKRTKQITSRENLISF